ncbi:hypothetical protein LZ31DRAFT_165956 [Colletotrichum somersetense]|nr:hypothetical protein LZ31DRAFT_165956 [Colletotrichum somersetense]
MDVTAERGHAYFGMPASRLLCAVCTPVLLLLHHRILTLTCSPIWEVQYAHSGQVEGKHAILAVFQGSGPRSVADMESEGFGGPA